ncbi:hypothetical protein QTP88_009544 [Uroleucon formosanum]
MGYGVQSIDDKNDNHCNDVQINDSDDISLPTTKTCIHLTPKESSSVGVHTVNGMVDKLLVAECSKALAVNNSDYSCFEKINEIKGRNAWSWPSNEVAHLKRNSLNIFNEFVQFIPNEGELQYITPINHIEFLKVILEADRPNLTNKLKSCIAVSLRVDRSLDRNQIDNIHVLVKVVTNEGNPELIFLSFKKPMSRGVRGYYDAVKKAVNQVIPWNDLLVWYAVHRAALAWKKLTANVVEVKKNIGTCVSISSYFHQSGLRTKELKQIAEENNCKFISLPYYFEVRWTEFTHSLCSGILKNWNILVKYFTRVLEESQDSKHKSVTKGFLKFLTDYERLKLLCFVTDLGYLYSRFQKQLQADYVTIYDLEEKKNAALKCFDNLKKSPLMGGWEETLSKSVIETKTFNSTNSNDYEINIQLQGFTLHEKTDNNMRKKQHHLYITDHRSFCAIRNDSLEHLIIISMKDWIQVNDFISAYHEAASISNINGKKASFELLRLLLQCDAWKPLSTSMARVLSAKPHSADVERLISYYNIIKTTKWSRLAPDIIKDAFYIKINMPTLSEFDPLPATKLWINKKSHYNKTHPEATKQRWFRGVFPDAEKDECDDHENQQLNDRFLAQNSILSNLLCSIKDKENSNECFKELLKTK